MRLHSVKTREKRAANRGSAPPSRSGGLDAADPCYHAWAGCGHLCAGEAAAVGKVQLRASGSGRALTGHLGEALRSLDVDAPMS